MARDFPLLRKRQRDRRRVEDRESGRRENDIAPVQLIPPRQHRGRDDRRHDSPRGCAPARASPQRERDEHEAEDYEPRHDADQRKPKGREVDVCNSEEAKEQDRGGDAGGHGEKPAEWLALRGEQRLRRLIAPGHERIETGEEPRARGRGEDRAGADG